MSPGERASSRQEAETDGLLFIRRALSRIGLSNQPIDIILDSWRVSTKKQYSCYIHKWLLFADKPSISALEPDITHVLEFLNSLFDAGLKYSAINTAHSALSMFLGITAHDHVGKHPLVIRFMKGIVSRRRSLPRYSSIWDVGLVFDMFKQQPLVQFLSLYDLTLRTVMLLTLVSAQRGQSLHLLDIKLMTVTADAYIFMIMGDFKQSRKGHENLKITLNAFKDDVRLCIVNTLTVYLERTAGLRNSSKLFISLVKPHNAVQRLRQRLIDREFLWRTFCQPQIGLVRQYLPDFTISRYSIDRTTSLPILFCVCNFVSNIGIHRCCVILPAGNIQTCGGTRPALQTALVCRSRIGEREGRHNRPTTDNRRRHTTPSPEAAMPVFVHGRGSRQHTRHQQRDRILLERAVHPGQR